MITPTSAPHASVPHALGHTPIDPSLPIVLLGSDGMLGTAFCRLLGAMDRTIIKPTLGEVDLSHPAMIDSFAQASPRAGAIINCAAWTNVDGAETSEPLATAINGEAMTPLARWAQRSGCVLVNFGTDYVFRGEAHAPYAIDEPLAPLNAYGRSKAVGERALLAEPHASWLHVRTSWLYAPWGNNFVRTMCGLLATKPSISVVNDQRGRPTSAEHLAWTTMRLLEHGARGMWHATDGGECTWHEFTLEISRLRGASCDVRPCGSDQFPRPAKRPAYSVLDIEATQGAIGAMPDWRAHLRDVLDRAPW